MADKTKIDWADATWNPVTGCLHGCEYCYARGIARRFGGHFKEYISEPGKFAEIKVKEEPELIHVLDEPFEPFEMRSGGDINGVFVIFSTEGKNIHIPLTLTQHSTATGWIFPSAGSARAISLCAPWLICSARGCRMNGSGKFSMPAAKRRSTAICSSPKRRSAFVIC